MFACAYGTVPWLTRHLLQKAQDPSDHIKQCLAFLFKIECVEIVSTAKDEHGHECFLINVLLSEPDDKSKATATNFQIQRTFKDFKQLHKVVVHWSDKHMWLDPKYGVNECVYCALFKKDASSWPGSLTHITTSKKKLAKQLDGCLNAYIAQARRPRPSHFECQGFDHVPSIVTRFLLQGVPSAVDADGDNQASNLETKNTNE